MKCDRCGKNEATFYYKSNINGRVTETHLCPDCAGLCDRCGANLNLGPCRCQKPRDPRMAVLEQLLDNKTDEEEEAAHNSD